MPAPTKVSREEGIEVIREFLREPHVVLSGEKLPGPSATIWTQIGDRLNNKWKARDCYREIREDRRKIFTDAKKAENLLDTNEPVNESAGSFCNSTFETSAQKTDADSDPDWDASTLDTFNIELTEETWRNLIEQEEVQYGKRKYQVLTRGGWVDDISEIFYLRTQLPCAYVFKKGKLYPNRDSKHHVTIEGKCKACDNPFYAYVDNIPSSFPCTLRVRTRDTFSELAAHKDIRRPVRKIKRMKLGEEAANVGSSNWLKKNAANYTDKSARLPPTLPKLHVVQQCKTEFTLNDLGVKPEDADDVVLAIEKMRHSPDFPQYIHDVRRNRFYVSYSTPEQLHCYKRYIRSRQQSIIFIDGTGSIIVPIKRCDGTTSGHIFFYAICINALGMTMPVH